MRITVTVEEEDQETWSLSSDVELINIPGAWKIVCQEKPDIAGVGGGRLSAIADWIGKFYGENSAPETFCQAAVTTAIRRMRPDQLVALARAICAQLDIGK